MPPTFDVMDDDRTQRKSGYRHGLLMSWPCFVICFVLHSGAWLDHTDCKVNGPSWPVHESSDTRTLGQETFGFTGLLCDLHTSCRGRGSGRHESGGGREVSEGIVMTAMDEY